MSKPKVITIHTIQDRIKEALREGFFRFFLIVGEKGSGKSTLMLKTMKQVFKMKHQNPNQDKDKDQPQPKDMDEAEQEAWSKAFHHLTFTPQQFYRIYQNQKREIDYQLRHMGLPAWVLTADIEREWTEIINTVMKLDIKDFEPIREKYRIPCMAIDDMGAHLNRSDTSIYWDPYYQHLFADLTLIRPYIACIIATAPDVTDAPRNILKHVTDIIDVHDQGEGNYRIKKRFIRFQGQTVGGYTKLYDQTPVKWKELPSDIYSKYEVLRHLLSRKVSNEAQELLQSKKMEDMDRDVDEIEI